MRGMPQSNPKPVSVLHQKSEIVVGCGIANKRKHDANDGAEQEERSRNQGSKDVHHKLVSYLDPFEFVAVVIFNVCLAHRY